MSDRDTQQAPDKLTATPDAETSFSISELSLEFDVTPRTIRFYEDKELLSPRRDNGKRRYSNADKVRLRLILRGKRLGFSLDEIAEILNLYHDNQDDQQLQLLLHKIDERKKNLRQKIHDIDMIMADLALVEQQCLNSLHIDRPDKKTRLNMPPFWSRAGRPL